MNTRITIAQDSAEAPVFYLVDEHEHAEGASTALGFWIYLMSDCLIFAVLFAIFGVLGGNYAAGPSPKDLFDLPPDCNARSALKHGVRRHFLGQCHCVVIPTGSNDRAAAHFSAQAVMEM